MLDGAWCRSTVSRLTWQKGFDLLLAALPTLLAEGAQLAVLGTGDAALQNGLATAAAGLDATGRGPTAVLA